MTVLQALAVIGVTVVAGLSAVGAAVATLEWSLELDSPVVAWLALPVFIVVLVAVFTTGVHIVT